MSSIIARYLSRLVVLTATCTYGLSGQEPAHTDEKHLTLGAFKEAVKMVSPSVVSITVRLPLGFSAGEQRPLEGSTARGSGVIADTEGHIITNKHVVNDGHILDATVALADGREYPATLLGVAPETDIAVIRIVSSPESFTPARFGETDALEPGEIVIAVGAPFGLRETVTQGIVSAVRPLGNLVEEGAPTHALVQTDAAINPGNSGGALATLDGKVIGINTAGFTISGAPTGIGFAIPIEVALRAFERVKTGNTAVGWIGIGVDNLTQTHIRSFGLPQDAACVVVTRVEAAGPAAGALRQGDCIEAVNGAPTRTAVALRSLVIGTAVGSEITLRVRRGSGPPREVTLTVAEDPAMQSGFPLSRE